MRNYQKEFHDKLEKHYYAIFNPILFEIDEPPSVYGNSQFTPTGAYDIPGLRFYFLKKYFDNITPHDSLLLENEKYLPYKFLLENFQKIEILYYNSVGKNGFILFFKFKNVLSNFVFELYGIEMNPIILSDKLNILVGGSVPEQKNSPIIRTRLNCYSDDCSTTYRCLSSLKENLQIENKEFYFEEIQKNSIFLLSSQGFGSFKKTKYEIEKIDKECLDFYSDEIVSKSKDIIELINTRKKGMFLFHGEKGCGKTSFIKYIINNSDKDFYYVSGETASSFSSGSFLEFIAANSKNAVFVFEDNEHLIASRENKTSSVIADILNASDGILSDILSPIFIFTFNTKVENIDPAFLRPGRLILEQEFSKLPFTKAKKIAKKLKIKLEEEKEYSLAEIFEKQNIIDSHVSIRSKQFSTEKSHVIKGFSKSE